MHLVFALYSTPLSYSRMHLHLLFFSFYKTVDFSEEGFPRLFLFSSGSLVRRGSSAHAIHRSRPLYVHTALRMDIVFLRASAATRPPPAKTSFVSTAGKRLWCQRKRETRFSDSADSTSCFSLEVSLEARVQSIEVQRAVHETFELLRAR